MRRIRLLFWLLRIVLPAVVAYWSRRLACAVWHRVGAACSIIGGRQRRVGHRTAALIEFLGRANAALVIVVVLLILLVALRISAR